MGDPEIDDEVQERAGERAVLRAAPDLGPVDLLPQRARDLECASEVEMVLGQLFLITAVGKIVGSWRPRRWSDDAGAPDPEDAPPTPPGLDGSPAPRGDPGDR